MLDKLGAGVVAADASGPNGPVLADNAGRKGRECHGRAQTCTYGLQGGGGAAEHGGVVAAGGTSILEVQRRMTCGAYVQVGAGGRGALKAPLTLLACFYCEVMGACFWC